LGVGWDGVSAKKTKKEKKKGKKVGKRKPNNRH
jgi:hypothetical protein